MRRQEGRKEGKKERRKEGKKKRRKEGMLESGKCGRLTCWKRHQLVILLRQISLHAIRSLGLLEAAFGVVSTPERLEFGGLLDQGGDGDDGEVFGGKGSPFLAAVDDIFA